MGAWVCIITAVMILGIILFGIFIGGRMVEYNVEYWASRLADKPVDVSRWKSCVVGIFIGWNIAIPATLITWVFDLAD